MKYKIRPATKDDCTFCCRLTKRNMYDLFYRHWGGWEDSAFRKGYDAANVQMIIGKRELAGYLSVKSSGGSFYIDNIQISPPLQGKGLGTSVLVSFLKEHRDSTVRLASFQDNPAKRLYERLGFTVVKKDGLLVKMEKRPNDTVNRMR